MKHCLDPQSLLGSVLHASAQCKFNWNSSCQWPCLLWQTRIHWPLQVNFLLSIRVDTVSSWKWRVPWMTDNVNVKEFCLTIHFVHSEILMLSNYRRFQLMRFSVEEINNSTNLLPNVSLSYEMFDHCSDTVSQEFWNSLMAWSNLGVNHIRICPKW